MKFTLEVDLDALTDGVEAPDPAGELGRILRYWAAGVRHYPFVDGRGSSIYNSVYREVGSWRIC
ncbi:hypothetical protein [Nocardia callitridis]|uniref:Uncharacterized protein n=1 Tax=Nocardia callitridis TaxID=648753 RepID=A0ABP9K077_9NOCA